MFRALILASLALSAVVRAAEVSPGERLRIDYLLQVVGSMQDSQFLRNGKAYDSSAAADHLRVKLRAAGGRVHTAEDFIRYCASASSISGRPYEIRFADGRTVEAAGFLSEKLREFDTRNPRNP